MYNLERHGHVNWTSNNSIKSSFNIFYPSLQAYHYCLVYIPLISFWVAMKACLRRNGWSRSGTSSPSCLKHCARAVPPSLFLPPDRSMRRRIPVSPLEGPFRSGVTTCLMFGHGAYVEITRAPETPMETSVYFVCNWYNKLNSHCFLPLHLMGDSPCCYSIVTDNIFILIFCGVQQQTASIVLPTEPQNSIGLPCLDTSAT